MQDLFFQKQKAEKEKEAAEKVAKEAKKTISKAEMKKTHVKMAGKRDKFGNEIDESLSDRSDDDY